MDDTGEALRGVLRSVPMSVVVVTVPSSEGAMGMTAGSFTSVSLAPPLISFNVMKSSRVHDALLATPHFAVSLLAEDQAGVAGRFATPGLDAGAQFDGVGHTLDDYGSPRLDRALGWLTCERREVVDAGDHSVIVASVLRAEAGRDARPLLYHRGAYRGIGGPVPEN